MTATPPPPRELWLTSGDPRLAALLYLPAARPPAGALLVCHGAGSRKENHAIMAEQAAARGLAAMVFDFRGHGASEGTMDAEAADDVVAAARALLAESGAPWVAGRGSSLGAYWLLRAARRRPGLFSSLVLLCPADEASLLRGLDRFVALAAESDDVGDFAGRFDVPGLRALWRETDLFATARGLRSVLVAHARDDDEVPFAVGKRLAGGLDAPSRFIALPRGGHKGPQRSPLVARATLDWVLTSARPSQGAERPAHPS
jgi:alpha-beta hydrolase superfamily lysophospholipase